MSELDNTKESGVSYRLAEPGDESFIYATWLRGLRYGNDWFTLIEAHAYYENYNRVIKSVLSRPDTVVKIACLSEDPEVVLGYCVYEEAPAGTTLHWVHVKSSWRLIGLAQNLVPNEVSIVTHVTRVGVNLMKSKLSSAVFNPFLTA